MYGECIVTRWVDQHRTEHLRVDVADSIILVSDDLIAAWMTGQVPPGVRLEEGGVFAFGTPGLGEGHVSYQIGDRVGQHSHEARRIA